MQIQAVLVKNKPGPDFAYRPCLRVPSSLCIIKELEAPNAELLGCKGWERRSASTGSLAGPCLISTSECLCVTSPSVPGGTQAAALAQVRGSLQCYL